jgi:hypothetical protein
MDTWTALLWGAVILGGPAALYGLHRLALWLEDRGQLYYRRERPAGGAAGGFTALQELVEPHTKHVYQVRDEARPHAERDAPGQGDPPGVGESRN